MTLGRIPAAEGTPQRALLGDGVSILDDMNSGHSFRMRLRSHRELQQKIHNEVDGEFGRLRIFRRWHGPASAPTAERNAMVIALVTGIIACPSAAALATSYT